MAATARWWERSAQASISSRVTSAWTAAFQPTVIDMSRLGASGVSRWLGRVPLLPVVGAQDPPAGARATSSVEWAPPATTTRSMPARIDAAALWTALSPDAQCRFWATPGACTSPASMAA